MPEALGAALMAASLLLSWVASPRRGQETRLMRLPGMWIVIPLLIMLAFLGGGAVIYEAAGR